MLTKSGVKAVGVEGNRLTLARTGTFKELAPKVTFVPVNGVVEAQRVIKDPSETEKIRDAVRVAERAFRMFIATLRETDTEKEMVDALEWYVRRSRRAEHVVPADRRRRASAGALPHAPPTASNWARAASCWSIGARTSSTSPT